MSEALRSGENSIPNHQQKALDSLVAASSTLTESIRRIAVLNAQLTECGCSTGIARNISQLAGAISRCHSISISTEDDLVAVQKVIKSLLKQDQPNAEPNR
jgi:hypothetical protein